MISPDDVAAISSVLDDLFEGTEQDDITTELTDFGADALLADDPALAVPLLFQRQGRHHKSSPLLQHLLLGQLDVQHAGRTRLGGVVLSTNAELDAPAGTRGPDGLRFRGFAPPVDGPLVVPVAGPTGAIELLVIDHDDPGVTVTPIVGFDQWLGWRWLDAVDPTIVEVLPVPVQEWQRAIAWARIALAHELIGVARASLALACDHARDRVQFGRPLAAFQVVRHKLAEVSIAVEGAQSCADVAATAHPLAAMVAKASAGRAAEAAARHCLQVLGGTGFTWEHPFHRFQKRGLMLGRVLGCGNDLEEAMGRIVLEAPTVPLLIDL